MSKHQLPVDTEAAIYIAQQNLVRSCKEAAEQMRHFAAILICFPEDKDSK